jgi:hypothetical protein
MKDSMKHIRYTDNVNSTNSRSLCVDVNTSAPFDAQETTSGMKQTNVKVEVGKTENDPHKEKKKLRHPEDGKHYNIFDSDLPT